MHTMFGGFTNTMDLLQYKKLQSTNIFYIKLKYKIKI